MSTPHQRMRQLSYERDCRNREKLNEKRRELGQAPLPKLAPPAGLTPMDIDAQPQFTAEQYQQDINNLHRQVRYLENARGEDYENIAARDGKIGELEATLSQLNIELATLRKANQAAGADIGNYQRALAEAQNANRQLQQAALNGHGQQQDPKMPSEETLRRIATLYEKKGHALEESQSRNAELERRLADRDAQLQVLHPQLDDAKRQLDESLAHSQALEAQLNQISADQEDLYKTFADESAVQNFIGEMDLTLSEHQRQDSETSLERKISQSEEEGIFPGKGKGRANGSGKGNQRKVSLADQLAATDYSSSDEKEDEEPGDETVREMKIPQDIVQELSLTPIVAVETSPTLPTKTKVEPSRDADDTKDKARPDSYVDAEVQIEESFVAANTPTEPYTDAGVQVEKSFVAANTPTEAPKPNPPKPRSLLRPYQKPEPKPVTKPLFQPKVYKNQEVQCELPPKEDLSVSKTTSVAIDPLPFGYFLNQRGRGALSQSEVPKVIYRDREPPKQKLGFSRIKTVETMPIEPPPEPKTIPSPPTFAELLANTPFWFKLVAIMLLLLYLYLCLSVAGEEYMWLGANDTTRMHVVNLQAYSYSASPWGSRPMFYDWINGMVGIDNVMLG